MRLIDVFVEKALNDKGSFEISIKEKSLKDTINYHFLQSNVGKARYIYGMKSWNDEKFYSKVDLKPKLIAIVSEGIVYIVDEFFLGVYNYNQKETWLPKDTKRFDEVVKEINEYVSNKIFVDFYNALDIENITDKYTIEECKKRARNYLFSKEPNASFEDEKVNAIFNENDIANSICGFIDIETEANKRLDSKRAEWILKKSINEKIRNLMKDSETAFDWEIAIAEGIRSVDAKTVIVEFELNGKRASEKITPDNIIRILRTNDYFSGYNFKIAKNGNELLKDLGAESGWNSKNAIRCEHIVKITYGKKELYVRK